MTRRFLVLAAAMAIASALLLPDTAAAQRRGGGPPAAGRPPAPSQPVAGRPPASGRPAQGRAVAVPRRYPPYGAPVYRQAYRPYYYRPYYPYYPYYGPGWGWGFGVGFGWGWGAGYYQWGYPYGQYPYGYPWGYPSYYYEAACDLRLQVQPRNAEVYLDGYFVGTVDDFDGVFQRLRVPFGEHDVEVHLDGFRPIRQRMLFRPGESYNLKDAMQPLAPGDPVEPRPRPVQDPRQPAQPRQPLPPQEPYQPGRPDEPAWPPPQRMPVQEDRGAFGTLSIRVQPADAEITIDGERWNTAPGEARLTVDLIEGLHRVEIRKPGFRPYIAEVRVNRGEMVPLNVSLPRSDG